MSAIFSLDLTDLSQLKAHYLPFFKRGGIFIPTSRQENPGAKITVELKLAQLSDPVTVDGQLAWRTPVGAQDRRLPGLGLHFAEGHEEVKNHIDKLLANFTGKEVPSHTI